MNFKHIPDFHSLNPPMLPSFLYPVPHLSLCWLTRSVDLTQRRGSKERVSSECSECSSFTSNLAVNMEIIHITVFSPLWVVSLSLVPYRATREDSNHLLTDEIAEPAVSYVVYLISVGES